jgi:antitoxin (DNA-binding transcriptional repressor) of toxin-antitoxin stability system
MKASILDLRQRMGDVLRALEKNEPVTILHRGKEKGVIYPLPTKDDRHISVTEHPAFGMWKDREDLQDVDQVVRNLRKSRYHAL